MAKLSPTEVGTYAFQAGITDTRKLAEAIAIAQAESGLNTTAKGDTTLTNATWGPSIGLWQIRSLNAERGKGTTRDETKLSDPAFNARSMASISQNGNNWGPWSVWPLRALPFVPAMLPIAASIKAAKGVSDVKEEITESVDSATQPIQDMASIAKAGYQWVSDRDNIIRVGQYLLGLSLLMIGLAIFAKGPIQSAASTATSVVLPVKKIAKVIKK